MMKNLVECMITATVLCGWFMVIVFGWQLGLTLTAILGLGTWALTPVAKMMGIDKLFEE